MGIETALIVAAVVSAGAVAYSASQKPGSPDAPQIGLTEQEESDITGDGDLTAGRRATLTSGQPQGILTPGTTNRSRLLGNA